MRIRPPAQTGSPEPSPSTSTPLKGLPPLLTGHRRRYLAGLVLAGLAQAVAAGATVVVLSRGLAARTLEARVWSIVVLVAIACAVGWVRSRERLLAERLGQDYVHEIRLGLVRRVLDGHRGGSLGATLTRASNDLNAVRNWVALGIGPLATGIPLVLGCTVVLGFIHPVLAVAVLAPLSVLALVLWSASRAAYEQSQRVRRERGRLAGHLADTLTATTAIRTAGGGYRELKRLTKRSAKVVDAAIDRARVVGRIRGTTTAATGVATATVIAGSMFAGLGGAVLAAALTVVGLLAAPVQELGRVVEYRQSFRAARDVLVPALGGPRRRSQRATNADDEEAAAAEQPLTIPAPRSDETEPETGSGSGAAYFREAALVVHGLRLDEDPEESLPALYARAGDRVVVRASHRARSTTVLETLTGVRTSASGRVRVCGKDLAAVSFRERRELLGYAAQGMSLERTTIARAVRYRRPDSDPAEVGPLLSRVGLAPRVGALPDGERTRLRSGGSPLTTPDRARLLLARAMNGDPPLLVLDHIDADIDEQGRRTMRQVLADYPGVVVVASDRPESIVTPTRHWNIG
jgi:ABC-type multidrug transport system fused ATPase/permease subunit